VEKVHFHSDDEMFRKADRLFRETRAKLLKLLPGADVEHVGSTAVPGVLTKGDLDTWRHPSSSLYDAGFPGFS
jgi:GrpB-like predicted nucleotidyltransferase (UPF0157 family)